MTYGAFAQTPPDAGALQQQIDRERQQALPKRMAPEKSVAPAVMKPVAGISITVNEFRFAGNTLITSGQLGPVVASYLNRPLDFAQLQSAAVAVAEAYRAAGWVVRAYLPQQEVAGGIVTIQIVEAVFGGVRREGPEPARVRMSYVLGTVDDQQKKGAPLNLDAMDRALLLADDLPGVTVAGSLAQGAGERETELILKLADEPLFVGEAGIDNTGSRSTGTQRITANLTLNSPMGFGESIGVNVIHTQGSDYFRLGYTQPVGSDGWRVGANVSQMDYRLIQKPNNPDTDKGSSSSMGVEASYPVIRSRLTNLFLNLNADHRSFDNQIAGVTSSHYTIDSLTFSLNANLFDNLGGGGANSASLSWVTGHQSLGTLDIGENAKLDARYSKLRYSLSRQQVITNAVSFYAVLSGQEAGTDLDSSEKFYLGGANGVRAYPSGEGGGSSGVMANLELRWKLPEGFVLTGFHDYGHVRNDAAMSYSLKGTGLSLAWQTPLGLNLKAVWSHRLGANPNPVAGNDQDGTLIRNRLWLQATLPF
jgi:hemolysin activation/secretion protein